MCVSKDNIYIGLKFPYLKNKKQKTSQFKVNLYKVKCKYLLKIREFKAYIYALNFRIFLSYLKK